jgi:predicted RNase H-like HicB family nuclease
VAHYYVIAERGEGRTWWLSFPDGPGIFSAADDAAEIPAQAHDALETVLMHPAGKLPRSIEDGARPPTEGELADFEDPTIVLVVPFEAAAEAKEAA